MLSASSFWACGLAQLFLHIAAENKIDYRTRVLTHIPIPPRKVTIEIHRKFLARVSYAKSGPHDSATEHLICNRWDFRKIYVFIGHGIQPFIVSTIFLGNI